MLTAIIPDPEYFDDARRKEIHGNDSSEVARKVRDWISQSGYGASDIGSKFGVYSDGSLVANVRYNGTFQWCD